MSLFKNPKQKLLEQKKENDEIHPCWTLDGCGRLTCPHGTHYEPDARQNCDKGTEYTDGDEGCINPLYI